MAGRGEELDGAEAEAPTVLLSANAGPTTRGDGTEGNDTLVKMSALLEPTVPPALMPRPRVPYGPRCIADPDADLVSDEEEEFIEGSSQPVAADWQSTIESEASVTDLAPVPFAAGEALVPGTTKPPPAWQIARAEGHAGSARYQPLQQLQW